MTSWRTVLWDFDGTLAHRPGLWSQAMVDVLAYHDPDHGHTREDVRAALRDGFPWHRWREPHAHLNEPDQWWADVNQLIHTSYERPDVSTRQT